VKSAMPGRDRFVQRIKGSALTERTRRVSFRIPLLANQFRRSANLTS
jgi:hypothetical protein